MNEHEINQAIKDMNGDTDNISDGYHTFGELYDHRITLFIALASVLGAVSDAPVWRSKRHSDGELCFGTGSQYVLGIGTAPGEQITYHIPIERWNETNNIQELEKAPEFDGHTSDDVLERIKRGTVHEIPLLDGTEFR